MARVKGPGANRSPGDFGDQILIHGTQEDHLQGEGTQCQGQGQGQGGINLQVNLVSGSIKRQRGGTRYPHTCYRSHF